MRDLFNELRDHFNHNRPLRNGFVDVDCPFCGAKSTRTDPHFGFNDKFYKCFVCHETGGLVALAKHVGIWDRNPAGYRPPVRPRPQPAPEPPPGWLSSAKRIIASYESHPQVVQRWQAYKPVTEETIRKHHFGYGVLPGDREARLIVPVMRRGKVVGLVGRSINGAEPKWRAAKGSKRDMWNLDNIRKGVKALWICENYVDAALIMQVHPQYDAIATGMARALRPNEIEFITRMAPQLVIVAMDNDLAGQAEGKMFEVLAAEWQAEHPGLTLPGRAGIKSVNALLEAGYNKALLFHWPPTAPPKADIGWALMQEIAA